MNTAQIIGLIAVLAAPYLLVAALTWTAYRKGYLRLNRDQFHWAAPLVGRLADHNMSRPADHNMSRPAGSNMSRPAGSHHVDDRDSSRTQHDFDAIRSRFEHQPAWPASGTLGERR